MSVQTPVRPVTVPAIRAKKGQTPVVCLTAYTMPMAQLLDPYADLLLVGDSLGNVVYGLPTTIGVSLDMMIAHGAAVVRGAKRACVIVDLPFGSYERSREQAFDSAVRVMKETQAAGVKLEGGVAMAETIAFLTARGIPVMAHVGLTPQAVHALGGFKARGTRGHEEWDGIRQDAKAVAEAGAFSVVLEAVAEPLARLVTEDVAIPTIGIGASAECDGQILVVDDMLGMGERTPQFVKRYDELGQRIATAAAAYAEDVRARRFPAASHTYRMKN
ncbi:3-methyl-2-oxobutanoate hydroxymethyltransferase [Zavarzinia sp. CC-PAN008]|uniref:3-methyl-2-oxobutanoate hydroxymethyltransferase n=1 Tax=Zavarzinia sp. CC-PAN008 TaxID=3243332 RepID=UPI003F74A8DE